MRHVGDDVGVAQLAQELSLTHEALSVPLGAVRLKQLERDQPSSLLVDGTEDRAHTARSDLTLDQETLREQLACDGGAMVLESVTPSRPSLSAMP